MKKIFTIFTIITVSLYHCVTTVSAQSVGLSISPPVTEIILAPNKKMVHAFTLKNLGESTQIIANIYEAIPRGINGQVTLSQEPVNPTTIPLIITLQNSDLALNTPFLLNAGENKQLVLGIEAANIDSQADVYLALVLSPVPQDDLQNITSVPSISALILSTITATGAISADVSVNNFATPLIHDSWDPFIINPSLKNDSPFMLRPTGTFAIISPSGNTIYSLDLSPNLILGNSERIYQDLSWQPKISNLGPYRISLTITTNGGTKLSEVERIVWILPVRLLIVFTLLAILLTTLLIIRHKAKDTLGETIDTHHK